jgi:hypothetical protein
MRNYGYGPKSATHRAQGLLDAQNAEIKRLTAENEELRRRLRVSDISVEAMAEVKATNDGLSDQTITEIVDGCLAEIAALRETS